MTEEHRRIVSLGAAENGVRALNPWYRWGPYVSERQWGTVREDYSPDGDAWAYLSHDDARSTAYRWGEDGLAGFCDIEQRLCLGIALWNGRDRILKERIFGLTQAEGNHGEDAKEYWWYHDALPSHVWNVWRYHYPHVEFPYDNLRSVNARRGPDEPEYELLDTGAFDDDRYWAIEVRYAKAEPTDVLMEIKVTNAGPTRETLHVLPTAWFRNTWSWGLEDEKPELRADGERCLRIHHPTLGDLRLIASVGPDGLTPTPLLCDNETNTVLQAGGCALTQYPKDGINDHVISGTPSINPAGVGTKGSFWYVLDVDAGATVQLRLRLQSSPEGDNDERDSLLTDKFTSILEARRTEADEFYTSITPADATPDEGVVLRQAFAGLLWSKQLYNFDVSRWLDGDPNQPPPPIARQQGRDAGWRNLNAFEVMSLPDKWEYPWFAAWDLAFQCVALANVDPAFAKRQLTLLCGERFQQPEGALPANEWDFDDMNPPVQAWAALEIFWIDGSVDIEFLTQIFNRLLVNFTWWANLEDESGSTLFRGGYLGLDNIGILDRSRLPSGYALHEADAAGWMAFYALSMCMIALVLDQNSIRTTPGAVIKFLEQFILIRDALEGLHLWDEQDGFYYNRLVAPDGAQQEIEVRSMVGVVPLLAMIVLNGDLLSHMESAGGHIAKLARSLTGDRVARHQPGAVRGEQGSRLVLLGVVDLDRVVRLMSRLLDETEFLSPHGLRSLSAYHRDNPVELSVSTIDATIAYEPADSRTYMFGGNSNWRGPVWFPLNFLAYRAIERLGRFFDDELTVEYPTGSGSRCTFTEVADDLARRLIGLFLIGFDGRRPCHGEYAKFRDDPRWRDNLQFSEYFNGDTGAGLGASHQTGWTGLVATLIIRSHGTGAQGWSDLIPRDGSPN